ncbi:unnamed protein product [Darwinula stevensoni]|uniref:RNA polymerase II-associated protein 1 n=1 Tax=Darwinula stevensoni TaxID=69355 RepID=A0A7R8ZXU4_9CRUS|nr:unnamed protein product [Darwinula stevensoni]CAG0879103.1 unnamed protein product [Darwinula stevensoni]
MEPIRRPKPGEDEDTLLAAQKEFLFRKEAPSAHVAPKPGGTIEDVGENVRITSHERPNNGEDILQGSVSVLGDVVERNVKNRTGDGELVQLLPMAVKEGHVEVPSQNKPRSLFASQMKRSKAPLNQKLLGELVVERGFYQASVILDGMGLERGKEDAEAIHQENIEKLSQMTREEILLEQQKLLASIDPKIVNFLRAKRKQVCTVGIAESGKEDSCISQGRKVELSEEVTVKEFPKDELPIDLNEASSRWIGMSKIETQKLAWMTELPLPKPIDSSMGYVARFNFEGDLLPYATNVPVTQGLHHHGEEPERAGYSLEELFTFIRSTTLQQRVLGLKMIGNIMKKYKEGAYDGCFQENLLKQVLDSGLLFLLRVLLDDNTSAVMAACVHALYHLIASDPDELCMDQMLGTVWGLEQPSLLSELDLDQSKRKEFIKEERGLKDAELLQLDAIRALIRMDILPRVRYMLDVCQPAAKTVVQLLGLLIRMVRHSDEATTAIMDCPYLMETIFQNFLPLDPSTLFSGTNMSQLATAYGIPMRDALKLVRLIASRGRGICCSLLSRHNLMQHLLAYMSFDPRDFYPLLMRQLHYYEAKVSLNEKVKENQFNFCHGAEIFNILNVAVKIAQDQDEQTDEPSLRWEHVKGLREMIIPCLKKWIVHLTVADSLVPLTFSRLKLVSSCLSLAGNFLKEGHRQGEEVIQEIEKLTSHYFDPFLKSSTCERLMQALLDTSVVLSELQPGTCRDAPNLPSLGSVTFYQAVTPIMQEEAPFLFWSTFTGFLLHLWQFQASQLSVVQVTKGFFGHPGLKRYLTAVAHHEPLLKDHWFARLEFHFLSQVLLLDSIYDKGFLKRSLVLNLGLKLANWFQVGDEYLLSEVLTSVVFNPFYIMSENEVHPVNELVNRFHNRLPMIRETMMKSLLSDSSIKLSKSRKDIRSPKVETYTVQGCGSSVLPRDWMFLPLMKLYSDAMEMKKANRSVQSNESTVEQVKSVLQWIYLLEESQSKFMHSLDVQIRITRLTCVFLAADDLFLDVGIQEFLEKCFTKVLREEVDFSIPVPGLSSFYDFYVQLVEQFEGVSYGNPLFGSVILLPLMQNQDISFRKLLWAEHDDALALITTSLDKLLVSIQKFLHPVETDESLLSCYAKAIFSRKVVLEKNPVMYVIACHHLHYFLVSESKQSTLRIQLKKQLLSLKNEASLEPFSAAGKASLGTELIRFL